MNYTNRPKDDEQRIGKLRKYFDEFAWAPQDSGRWTDTELEVSTTRVNDWYAFREHARNRRTIKEGGAYFLDAGCGARPYTIYASGFRHHVCLDFSMTGLKGARQSLGGRGFFVCGDIRHLPFKPGVFDGLCCPYVIYHVAGAENQQRAFRELHAVLRASSSGVVIYDNPTHAGVVVGRWLRRHPRLRHALDTIGRQGKTAPPARLKGALKAREELLHYEPLPAARIKESIAGGDAIRIMTHSLLTEPFKRAWLRDSALWKVIVRALLACESAAGSFLWPLAPVWCIVIQKRD
jgi:hypothetical protein